MKYENVIMKVLG